MITFAILLRKYVHVIFLPLDRKKLCKFIHVLSLGSVLGVGNCDCNTASLGHHWKSAIDVDCYRVVLSL